jgi:hypothetical protein
MMLHLDRICGFRKPTFADAVGISIGATAPRACAGDVSRRGSLTAALVGVGFAVIRSGVAVKPLVARDCALPQHGFGGIS